jgi:hypothetical protein
LWPMSSATVRRSTPAITRRLAKVCRKQYHVKFLYPGLAGGWIKPVFVAFERFPMNVNKNSPRTSGKSEQRLQSTKRDTVQGNVPRLPVFAVRDRNLASNKIDPVPRQTVLFAGPHSRV